MALINRVTRLFQADLHAVLDRIEEPEQLLRHAIREMEEELSAAEQRLSAGAGAEAACERQRKELERKLGEIEDELDLCFAAGEADLARGLVRRKLEIGRLAKHIKTRQQAVTERLESDRRALDERRTTLESLRQKAEVFTPRTPGVAAAAFDEAAWTARELNITDEEVEIALLREKQSRSSS